MIVSSMMKTYAHYLETVLGVRAVMLDQPTVNSISGFAPPFFVDAGGDLRSPLEKSFRLVLLNWISSPQESLFYPEVSELFVKMLGALKLPEDQVLAIDCLMNERPLIPAETQKFFKSKAVLMFAREPEALGKIQIKGGFQWMETFSPAYLLEHPEAKRVVWNDMQKLLKEI